MLTWWVLTGAWIVEGVNRGGGCVERACLPAAWRRVGLRNRNGIFWGNFERMEMPDDLFSAEVKAKALSDLRSADFVTKLLAWHLLSAAGLADVSSDSRFLRFELNAAGLAAQEAVEGSRRDG